MLNLNKEISLWLNRKWDLWENEKEIESRKKKEWKVNEPREEESQGDDDNDVAYIDRLILDSCLLRLPAL